MRKNARFGGRRHAVFAFILPVLLLFLTLCKGQQAPFYNTAKFDETAMHRTNLCERQQQLFGGNITLANALRGLNLSTVLLKYQDDHGKRFFHLNDDGVIDEEKPGLLAVIMDELAERAGFSWRNSYGVVLPINSTTDGDKTYSDLLEWEVQTYDISAGKWDRSIARMKREISFPEGWYDSSMVVIHVDQNSSSDATNNIWAFFLPFSWEVWVLIVVVVIVSGAVYFALERMNYETDERELERNPCDAMYYTTIIFTGHFELRPNTVPAMILTFSLTFVALLIAAIYTANLASFLVARYQPAFGIDSVEKAVIARAPTCIEAKVNIDDYLSAKYETAILVRKETKDEVYHGLKSGECTVAVVPVSEYEEYKRDVELNKDCTLTWQGRVEEIVPSGFVSDVDSGIQCTSLVTHVLDLHLLEMKADGFLDGLWRDFLLDTGDQSCVEAEALNVDASGSVEDDTYSLGIVEMAGIFIIHAIFVGSAIIVALIQYCLRKKRERLSRLLSGIRQQDLAREVEDTEQQSPSTNMNGVSEPRPDSSMHEDSSSASSTSQSLRKRHHISDGTGKV